MPDNAESVAPKLPTDHATEWGIFSDEGCMERGLYGADSVREALTEYDPDDNAEPLPLCNCTAECECPQGMCECDEDDEDPELIDGI